MYPLGKLETYHFGEVTISKARLVEWHGKEVLVRFRSDDSVASGGTRSEQQYS